MKQIILQSADKIIFFLVIKFYFFSTFWKITVGGTILAWEVLVIVMLNIFNPPEPEAHKMSF